MQEILQQQRNEIYEIDVKNEKSNTSDEVRINKMVSRHFVWFMNNNIEEFQTFYRFWNQLVTNQLSPFLR